MKIHPSLPVALLALSLAVAACGGAATAPTPGSDGSPGPGTGSPAVSPPAPTPVPGTSGEPGTGAKDPAGGGTGSQPGTGVDEPVAVDPGVVEPGAEEPTMVVPVAGLRNIRDVAASRLDASVRGREVAVRVSWWSGVEPCASLAGVAVARDGNTIELTVKEGATQDDVACIEIAVYKATVVELGELEPGSYTIRAFGDAAPIEVVVAG